MAIRTGLPATALLVVLLLLVSPSVAEISADSPSADVLSPSSGNPPSLPSEVAFQQFSFQPDSGPSGRHGAIVGFLNGRSSGLYVLGGRNASSSFSDVWIFSTDSSKWIQLAGVNVDLSGSAFAQADGTAIFLYGGVNSAGARQTSVQVFDMALNKLLSFQNSTPPPAIASQGVAGAVSSDGNYFHVFGGQFADSSCSSAGAAWASDQRRWITWNVNASRAPSGRSNTAIIDYNGVVIMFGGACGGTDSDTNIWRFDYRTGNWSVDKNRGKATPRSRAFHIMVLDPAAPGGPALLVFGGLHKGSIYLSDVWSYDLTAQTWTRFAPDFLPPPRNDASGLFANGRLLFFGGHYIETDFNDVWQFVDQSDCLSAERCMDCTAISGCGWCWSNPNYYRCLAGASNHPYILGSCSSSSSTAFTNDQLLCPVETFPSWAIALIVIGGIVVIGLIIFAVMKMRSAAEYEEIK